MADSKQPYYASPTGQQYPQQGAAFANAPPPNYSPYQQQPAFQYGQPYLASSPPPQQPQYNSSSSQANYHYPQPKPASFDPLPPHQMDNSGSEIHLTSAIKTQMDKTTNKYNDLWALILYYVHLAAFFAVCGFFIYQYKGIGDGGGGGGGGGNTTTNYYIYSLLVSFGVAAAFTSAYFILLYKFAKPMIHATFIAGIGIDAAFAIYMFYKGILVGGVIFLLIAALNLLFYFLWRKKIPFAALLIKTVMNIMGKYPALFTLSPISGLLIIGYSMLLSFAVMGARQYYGTEQINYGLAVFLLFSWYWTIEVVSNTVHTTIAGTFATHYFTHGTGQTVLNPTLKSFRRAATWSFGSICFGSLIVALIQLIRAIVKSSAERNSLGAFCVDCILGMIERLIRYFNSYAYTEIAIYGKPFVQAAKDTWDLAKRKGIDAIINDQLVGSVLGLGMILLGAICGFIAYFIVANKVSDADAVIIIVMASIIGILVMAVVNSVISSGVMTTFVCLAEDPQALQRNQPGLFNQIVQVYPGVMLN